MKGILDMFISFKCPHCGTALQDPSDFAGKKGKCPRCKKEVIVPERDARAQGRAKEVAKKE